MTLIAVTGTIASGKSTAINLLKSHNFSKTPFDIRFVDLDEYCRLHIRNIPELEAFFREEFNFSFIVDAEFIIKNIFTDPVRYRKYCSCFVPLLTEYLQSLQEDGTIYIVEASAFYSYTELHDYFSSVIVLDAMKPIRERNRKLRGIKPEVYNIVNSKFSMSNIIPTFTAQLEVGTYQELRGKIEEALIYALALAAPDDKYLEEAANTLLYFSQTTSNDDWNYNPYHNRHHTRNVLTNLILTGNHTPVLGMTSIYHDWNYKPTCKENEDRSACFAYRHMHDNQDHPVIGVRFESILTDEIIAKVLSNTRSSGFSEVAKSGNPDLQTFFLSDISVFTHYADEVIESSQLIIKEYGHLSWPIFQTGNVKILSDIKALDFVPAKWKSGLEIAIAYVRSHKPRIGWFCGSFNPFTVGHLDILKKAEKQFDKVVIVQGINPDKQRPASLKNLKELESYEIIDNVRSIPKLLDETIYTPTLIRGVRNSQDVEDARIWMAQINEFTNDDVQCTMIFGHLEFSHISSSFVRYAQSLGSDISNFVVQ